MRNCIKKETENRFPFLHILCLSTKNILMINLLIRFMVIYFYMVFSMKLMGKRQVGEMQMSELVTAFFLSELATYTVTDGNIPLIFGLVPIAVLICIEVIVSFFAIKIPAMKRIFDFSPSLLIDRGKIVEKELLKNRVTLDELLSMLRLNGYYDVRKVNFAILEPNGQLSVIPYGADENVTCRDLGLKVQDEGFTVAVVDDGRVNPKALDLIGKTRKWLYGMMRKEKIKDPKEIFLLASDFRGEVFLIRKEKR